jgi:DDE superfamily endonuclease
LTPASPRKAQTIVDTPRRTRLICAAEATAGKLPRKQLFQAHGVSESTGYRILKSNSTRRGDGVHKRGRKPALSQFEREAIETVEDSSFRFGTARHYTVASALGLADASERAIQRNMAKHGVGTYMAQQKKYISPVSVQKREIWGFDRRRWNLEDFLHYRYSDECHFACGLQRQARIHRRRGREARNKPTKIQFRIKRRNQQFHVFAYIGHDCKSRLYFYEGSGVGGRLTQVDYVQILEDVVAPDWDPDWILLEDNDNSHGTRGNANNKCKQAKQRLGIKWEANPPESPDLNPIETIWRTVKQRLKNRGPIFDSSELKRAIQEEWDKITLAEINEAIATMPERVATLNSRNGIPIPF